jgi:nucleoside-diphosphate-sugar epimerase
MKVLVTGAFGNIGRATVRELVGRAHQVRCFDLKTKANLREASRMRTDVGIYWGDLRDHDDVEAAVHGQEAVVHLAFIIPRLSATGVNSEESPEWAEEINIGGTRNLIRAIKAQPDPPKLLFASSFHVYGCTQDQPPPRKVTDVPRPIEHYARHKIACERLVRRSNLDWIIFRLAAALPVRLILDPGMFDVGLDNRIEFVHSRDVGLAITNALEVERAWCKLWHIGGGPRCQIYQRELVQQILEAVGIGMLPEGAFPSGPYPTDWLDTQESQRVLRYQRHTLQDYLRELKVKLGFRRHFVRLLRPILRAILLSKSPVFAAREA